MAPFHEYVARVGRPYRWAQSLAGLHAPAPVDASSSSNGSVARHGGISGTGSDAFGTGGGGGERERAERRALVRVIGDIRARVDARQSLAHQLKQLAAHSIPVAPEAETLFPLKTRAHLKSWTEGKRTCGRRVFNANFARDNVQLAASISIGAGYPIDPPHFRVKFAKAPKGLVGVDNNLRAMEAEVNVHYGELLGAGSALLLQHQVRRLQMCFDLYMESEEREGKEGIGTGQLYLKAVKGRDRIKPFKWDARLGFFDHR